MQEVYRWESPLQVRMLGGFSISYKGESVKVGRMDRAVPMYQRFMLLLWLRGEQGATTDEVKRYIFGDKNLKNPRNSINNLHLQANSALSRAGLPEVHYFCRVGKSFQACREVPVELDVTRFRDLIARARAGGADSTSCCEEAVRCYTGPLLPDLSYEEWVQEESAELAAMYREACERTAGQELIAGNVQKAESVYVRAYRTEPDGSWETRRIELLLRQGRDREAIEMYDRAVQRYMRNMRSIRAGRIFESAADVNQRLLTFIQDTEDVFLQIEAERSRGIGDAGQPQAM